MGKERVGRVGVGRGHAPREELAAVVEDEVVRHRGFVMQSLA
jgi:hypothetical protein